MPTEKVCTHCRVLKPASGFSPAKGTKDGLHGWCRACNSAASLKVYARRRDIMRGYKDRPCADCEKSFPPYVMDFDHRDPKLKKFCIAENYLRLPFDQVLEEIKKCDVVCANCHRIRTYLKEQPRHLEGSYGV